MDLDALARTPEAFAAALDLLGPTRFAVPPTPDAWSPAQILIHVRAADAVIAPRIVQVLVRPGVVLPDFDERKVGDLLARSLAPYDEVITAFRVRRAELVALLATLTDEECRLHGAHEVRGRVSIDDLHRSIVDHEREHLDQLRAAVAELAERQV